uniref:hypothetical protein n=1 Tax=Streptococcus pluranimalium TaxID=82348 RepID=UPI003F6946A6
MKVIANPIFLDAFEWDGSKETFEKIKKLASNIEDDVYIRDGQLVVYDGMFEEEEVVKIGHFVVFGNDKIDTYSPIGFDILFQEVDNDSEV